jgi:hypothetical protein
MSDVHAGLCDAEDGSQQPVSTMRGWSLTRWLAAWPRISRGRLRTRYAPLINKCSLSEIFAEMRNCGHPSHEYWMEQAVPPPFPRSLVQPSTHSVL